MKLDDLLFVFDFDKTISTNDVVVDLLDLVGVTGWREMEEKADRGEISLRECLNWEMSSIKGTRTEYLQAIAQLMQLDEGARDLFRWLSTSINPVYIVSDSLKAVIEHAFEDLGLGDGLDYIIDSHAIEWDDEKPTGIKMANEDCEHHCANCKISKVQQLKEQYPDKQLVYVGDGFTDYLPAPLADIIFARENMALSIYLKKKDIDHYKYGSLHEVREQLSRIIA